MKENMNRATVLGCACVITSDFTAAEIEEYTHFLPEALVLTDEFESDIFRIELAEPGEPGCIVPDRIAYCRENVPGGKASVTTVLDPTAEDKEELVRNRLGLALVRLDALEKQMHERRRKLQENRQKAESLITAGTQP